VLLRENQKIKQGFTKKYSKVKKQSNKNRKGNKKRREKASLNKDKIKIIQRCNGIIKAN